MTSRQAGLLLLALCLRLCKAANDGPDDDDNVQIDPLNKLVLNPGELAIKRCLGDVLCSHNRQYRCNRRRGRGSGSNHCTPSNCSVSTIPQSKKRKLSLPSCESYTTCSSTDCRLCRGLCCFMSHFIIMHPSNTDFFVLSIKNDQLCIYIFAGACSTVE